MSVFDFGDFLSDLAVLLQKFVLALFLGTLFLVDLFLLNLLRDERS